MPSSVYSARFIATAGDPMPTATYTVPEGYVAVVRDVRGLVGSATSGNVTVTVAGTYGFIYVADAVSGQNVLVAEEMRVVVNAGETISAQSSTDALANLLVSGYLLTA